MARDRKRHSSKDKTRNKSIKHICEAKNKEGKIKTGAKVSHTLPIMYSNSVQKMKSQFE